MNLASTLTQSALNWWPWLDRSHKNVRKVELRAHLTPDAVKVEDNAKSRAKAIK